MCIIAYRPAEKEIPRQNLVHMFENNPHGAGFMYATNGVLHIRKGFLDIDSYLDEYYSLPIDCNLVIHTRIGTSGSNTAGNTHPYPVTNNLRDVKKLSLDITHGYAFAHNGILRDVRLNGDYNDSQAFGVLFLAPLAELASRYPNGLHCKAASQVIETAIAGSRIAIMGTDGLVTLCGDGWSVSGGVWYSNASYTAMSTARTPLFYSKNYGNSTPNYIWEDWD